MLTPKCRKGVETSPSRHLFSSNKPVREASFLTNNIHLLRTLLTKIVMEPQPDFRLFTEPQLGFNLFTLSLHHNR